MKGRDLVRDPRVTVHNAVAEDADGEFKIIGRAVPVEDAAWRERWAQSVFEAINWRPPDDSYLFTVDIERVWAIDYATGKQSTESWRAEG